jgi:hypothetical protein
MKKKSGDVFVTNNAGVAGICICPQKLLTCRRLRVNGISANDDKETIVWTPHPRRKINVNAHGRHFRRARHRR